MWHDPLNVEIAHIGQIPTSGYHGKKTFVMTNKVSIEQTDFEARVRAALEVARRYASIEGGHHKAWVIDQMVRTLAGEGYSDWINKVTRIHASGLVFLEWDTGIEP